MALLDDVRQELDRIAIGGSGGQITLQRPCGTFRAELESVDRIGCGFLRIWIETPRLAQATSAELQLLGEALAKRLTYLLEAIRLIEIDEASCVVQLRSVPPSCDGTTTAYYELLAQRGGQIELCRFNKPRGQTRHRIAAEVTREVFCRLAEDFEAAVEQS